MNGDVWRSRESELLSKYAERLRPADASDTEDEQEDKAPQEPQRTLTPLARIEEIDFSYINGPPPKDLLNYKNMDLEMSLWAKTGTGWMSVGILFLIMVACFIATCIMWIIHGPLY